jgi:hypothetical protein
VPTAIRWVGLALLGILIAAGVSVAASRLASQQIGLASEPISAGDALAPAVGAHPGRQPRSGSHRGGDGGTVNPPSDGPPVSTPPVSTTPVAPSPTSPQTQTPTSPPTPTLPRTEPPSLTPGHSTGADDYAGGGGGGGGGGGADD